MRISGITYATRKTHKARNIILLVIIALFLIVLSVAVISAYSGWKLLHPAKKDIEAFSSNIVPEYRDINFRGVDGSILLKGWFFQTSNSDRTVVLAHSYGKNRLEFGDASLNMIKEFLDKGYNVFTFDFRNSGKSDGKLTTLGYYEKDDLSGAIDYVKQQGSKHIFLLGFSTGASASILAAAGKGNVEAVIADSPYSNLKDYLNGSLDRWVGLPAFPFNRTVLISMEIMSGVKTGNADPLSSLKSLSPCRLLLIHGAGDKIIPVQNSRKLYSAYSDLNPDLAEIWETDDSGNATSYEKYPEEYMNKVFEFLGKEKTSKD